jgi:formylglycine-generating enzyme required for sulfatase activity/serine/threonine protein kinase
MTTADPLNLVGTTIADKYAVESVVGEGGFAIVYRATHLLWKRPVAVKVFRALGDFADEQRQRLLNEFLQEGALLADLSERSTAIVQARDVGEVILRSGDKAPYMVLEWLEGMTLERVLHNERAMGLPRRTILDALRLLEPAAEALALAHAKGIAHRDFKPANVFVLGDPRGDHTVKLLDFGIAKVVQDAQKMAGSFTKTAGQITSFTPQYGAPEQFNRAVGATGPWTDVFSLALVLVEVATGIEGHQGDTMMQMAFAAADPHARPTPRMRGAKVSDQVEAVFAKALAVRIEDRFQTAGAFWNALRATHNLDPLRSVTTDRSGRLQAAEAAAMDSAPTMLQGGPPTTQPASSASPMGIAAAPASRPASGGKGGLVAAAVVGVVALGGVGAFFGLRGLSGTTPHGSASASASFPAPPVSASAPVAPPTSCPEGMVFVAPGSFYMGAEDKDADDDEKPPHQVKLSGFCIDKTEVTVAAYAECTTKGKCLRAGEENKDPQLELHATKAQIAVYDTLCNIREPEKRATHPINCVDWHQAQAYCKFKGGRLPTEAEWEYAARGSDGRRYPWGDAPPAAGHFNACDKDCFAFEKLKGLPEPQALFPKASDGWATIAAVGSFPEGKSFFGLDDMVGNVYEWVADWYAEYPKDRDAVAQDPTGPAAEPKDDAGPGRRVARGGAWNGFDVKMVRPTYRYTGLPSKRSHGYGFRCAVSPK